MTGFELHISGVTWPLYQLSHNRCHRYCRILIIVKVWTLVTNKIYFLANKPGPRHHQKNNSEIYTWTFQVIWLILTNQIVLFKKDLQDQPEDAMAQVPFCLPARPSRGRPRPSQGHPRSTWDRPRPSRGRPRPSQGYPRPSRVHPMPSRGHPRPSWGHPRPSRGCPRWGIGQFEVWAFLGRRRERRPSWTRGRGSGQSTWRRDASLKIFRTWTQSNSDGWKYY